MPKPSFEELRKLVDALSQGEKQRLYQYLRSEVDPHPLEIEWNIESDYILSAIQRSPDITRRGIRGILAEAKLGTDIISPLKQQGWREVTATTDLPHDYLIKDSQGTVRIQVKNQRREKGKPLSAKSKFKREDYYIVETQKTRSGKNKDGETTRAYRYDEFDIIAVCLQPSTGSWNDFLFTVANWLLPSDKNSAWIGTYQPVPQTKNDVWTDDLEAAIRWFRSGASKRIWPPQDSNEKRLFD